MNVLRNESAAQQRKTWPIAVRRLQDGDRAAMPGSTVQQRIAAVGELTRQSWSLAGLDVPGYPRAATPIEVVSLSDPARARSAR